MSCKSLITLARGYKCILDAMWIYYAQSLENKIKEAFPIPRTDFSRYTYSVNGVPFPRVSALGTWFHWKIVIERIV
jgi:hypothetical protein